MILLEAEVRIAVGLAASITEAERAVLALLHPLAEGAVKSYLGYDPEYKDHVEFYPRARGYEREVSGDGWEVIGNRAVLSSWGISGDLQLQHIPVRQITEIRVDQDARAGQRVGSFASDTVLTAADDYWLDLDQAGLCLSGLVAGGSWPTTPGSIKVSYSAGYTQLELSGRGSGTVNASSIKEAALITAAEAMRAYIATQKTRAGWVAGRLSSESAGEYSYSLDGSGTAATSFFQISLPAGAQQRLQNYRHFGLTTL